MVGERVLARFDMLDAGYELKAYEVGEGTPRCAVVAGIHGDETATVNVARELIGRFDGEDLDGSILIIPQANVFACLENTRETPWPKFEEHESEERNLNRCFDVAMRAVEGEDIPMNLTQFMAYRILEAIRSADYLIDLHTATWPDEKVAQARFKSQAGLDGTVQQEMEEMARRTGLDVMLRTEPDEIGTGVLGSVAPMLGVPTVTLEIAGATQFTDADEERYAEAVERILQYAGIVEGSASARDVDTFGRLTTVYSSRSGTLEIDADLGATVAEGEIIARIRDPDGDTVEVIRSPVDGIIESMNHKQGVNQRTRVVKIAHD